MTADLLHPILATHNGKFHCDEVFAYAALRLALGLHEPGRDHTLCRTRTPALIEAADIVFDVGFQFDPAARRFDHHQRGAPLRPDGTPYSSAGLVWHDYGERAVSAILRPLGAERFAAAVAAEIDHGMVRRIDELDNGVSVNGPIEKDPLSLAKLIGDFNPPWDLSSVDGSAAADAAFREASALAEAILRRRVDTVRAKLAAEAVVLAAHAAGEDPRLLVLDQGMPWKNVVFTHDLPVLFTVSPAGNGNWMIDAMPPEPDSFAQRMPLPAAWAGLSPEELAVQTGVPDAVFVHLRRFVGAAKSRDGALAMARQALTLGEAQAADEA